uniref:Apocarotenoid-15,15'-oxygenase n=1 Tax=Auxenochlorella protothecoides TaxID=3075 RepID=A0A1D2ACD5_AUXPR
MVMVYRTGAGPTSRSRRHSNTADGKARAHIHSLGSTSSFHALASRISRCSGPSRPTSARSCSRMARAQKSSRSMTAQAGRWPHPAGLTPGQAEFQVAFDKGYLEATPCPQGQFLELTHGSIPEGLVCTYFSNGPGKFQVGGQAIGHPLDGDGFISSISVKGGKAFYRSDFVQTPEHVAGKILKRGQFRGTFGTQRAGGPLSNLLDLHVANTSNTSVVDWGGLLLSFFEGGQPYALHADTLRTLGVATLGGAVREGLPIDLGGLTLNAAFNALHRLVQRSVGSWAHLHPRQMAVGGEAVTAHPHVDPAVRRLVSFKYSVSPRDPAGHATRRLHTHFTFMELDGAGIVVERVPWALPGYAFVHDFVLTRAWYVVFENPVSVDYHAYMLGLAPAAASIRWDVGRPTVVHLIPRPGAPPGARPRRFELPPSFVFHHANAYEQGEHVIIDSVHYDSLPGVGTPALGKKQVDPQVSYSARLRRATLNLRTGVAARKLLHPGYLEFPSVNETCFGRAHEFVFAETADFEGSKSGLIKLDMASLEAETWFPGRHQFVGEPQFVPRPDAGAEDDGWLLACVFDSESLTSRFVILDAHRIGAGPIAVALLPHPLPHGLHGSCSDTAYMPTHGAGSATLSSNAVPFTPPSAPLLGGETSLQGTG